MSDQYLPPDGDKLGFDLSGEGYAAPQGDGLGFDFRYRPPYIPPLGSQVALDFGPAYTPPSGDQVALEFVPEADGPIADTQYLFPVTLHATGYGSPALIQTRFISPGGIASTVTFGAAQIELLTRYVSAASFKSEQHGTAHVWNWNFTASPQGFRSDLYGRPTVANTARQIRVNGLVATTFGQTATWNWLQYLIPDGYRATEYGEAFVQGGVKHVYPTGPSTSLYGRPTVVNTTADQFVSLSGRGIAPPGLGAPNVSPRSVFPFGIHGSGYGTALVQRTPAPYGFDTMVFGLPSIEYWTKYLQAAGIAPVEPGYPRVFDPTQKVFPVSVARSAVFGDTIIINQSRFIHVPGADHFQGSDWTALESNLRDIHAPGLSATRYGDTEIRNRWPTVAPIGFDALRPTGPQETGIGHTIRYIRPSGIYRTAYGTPVFTKTPEIAPAGFAGESGTPTVWFRIRSVGVAGEAHDQFGGLDIWFRYRGVSAESFAADGYGAPKVEHSRRELLTLGSSHLLLGAPRIENADRTIAPPGIYENFATGHMVGTDRWVRPVGYDAARFGARIIPEIQNAYPLGFTGLYGWPTIWNQTQLIAPAGFITVGQQPADRWGRSTLFNSDQYIALHFDPESQLNPPAWPQWTKIENRNRVMRAAGMDLALMGIPQIDNNARPLRPEGMPAPATSEFYKAGLVAYRVRHLPVQGLEAPYLGRWHAVHNDAYVISPQGMVASLFGDAELVNTRRYFPYITGGDLSMHGTPMIAYRIRELTFESRYGIAPPSIPVHEIKLHTRYVEPVGRDLFGQGWASLSIHRKTITPRWIHQSMFGWATARNLTPELGARGHNSELFGSAMVRLEWRPVYPVGNSTQLFGRSQIGYRDRILFMQGFPAWAMTDKHVVTKTGAPPYSEQTISLSLFGSEGDLEEYGYGIHPADELPRDENIQVPEPALNQSVIYVEQEDPSELFGVPLVRANSVRTQSIWEIMMGKPDVSLKVRQLLVDEWPDDEEHVPVPSSPRLSPLTIWAVKEPPEQAVINHPRPQPRLHYVDERPNLGGWVKGMGSPRVTHYHQVISPIGYYPRDSMGVPLFGDAYIFNRRSYIRPEGMPPGRIGWHEIPGDKVVEQYDSSDAALYGLAVVEYGPYLGPQSVSVRGQDLAEFGEAWVSLYTREFAMTGFLAERMGTRLPGDTPYAWRGLRVGPLMPTIPAGFVAEVFGEPWISHRVRGIEAQGYDAFRSEYEFENFHLRMRVRRYSPPGPPAVRLVVEGFDAQHVGTPDVKPGVHFIRPDGNSDQYRKGAF